jgi:hypothetical protein
MHWSYFRRWCHGCCCPPRHGSRSSVRRRTRPSFQCCRRSTWRSSPRHRSSHRPTSSHCRVRDHDPPDRWCPRFRLEAVVYRWGFQPRQPTVACLPHRKYPIVEDPGPITGPTFDLEKIPINLGHLNCIWRPGCSRDGRSYVLGHQLLHTGQHALIDSMARSDSRDIATSKAVRPFAPWHHSHQKKEEAISVVREWKYIRRTQRHWPHNRPIMLQRPDLITGYVYVIGGRVVGRVVISLSTSPRSRYVQVSIGLD